MKIVHHLSHQWAVLTGNHIRALIIMEQILMADFTAFDAALDRVTAKLTADDAALAAAQTADAALQSELDARTAKLDALAPAPAAPAA